MKRVLSALLVLILCLQMLPVWSLAADESGSPKHIPRVVSIVFDDSGSMYNNTDRWAYTVYAMQAFAAMMGSDDILYITYLNNSSGSVRVDLSDGAKAGTVSGFTNIRFGGGTPNKIQQGANCLTSEYQKHGSDANYYLVVMTDGALDGSKSISQVVSEVSDSTKNVLKGAEFETIYFTMTPGDNGVSGVKNYFATDTTKIVDALQDVSADIMGRTEVKHSVSGGKLKFDLSYPALSIAILAQKADGNFESFRATVQRDGKDFDCQVGNYPVVSPTSINKDMSVSPWQEKYPQNPPSGVVSLVTAGGTPLEKGSYTVDISGYNLNADDIVVLVEPAVRIGCKYFINDSKNPVTFEELKDSVQEGDTITVECGLYEMKADGSLGDPVPASVLSPEYKITINGKEVATASGGTNIYKIPVTKEFEEQELRVQALLKGYQPFVMKETFGKFNIKIRPVPLPAGEDQVRLTKPMWQQWTGGEGEITFKLEAMDASVPARTAIVVEGCQGFPAGTCAELGAAVRVEGNTIVYNPKADMDFAQLPASFTVGLKELATGEILQKVTVQVVQPVYRVDVKNGLDGTVLSLDQLKVNAAGITFTLKVDYDGSGTFTALASWDTGMVDKMTVATGDLPGKLETVYDSNGQPIGKHFVPQYDEMNNNGIPFTKVAGRIHSITATLESTNTTAETKVETLAPDYDIVVYKEGITLTDTSLALNTEYVEFLILRDGKKLSKLELEGLAPYPLSFDNKQSRMTVETVVFTYPDGTSVLRCTPGYKGWCFPSREMNWMAMLTLFSWWSDVNMHLNLTLGGEVAKAAITLQTSMVGWTILGILLAIICVIAWITISWCTYARFEAGFFYTVTFNRIGTKYKVSSKSKTNPNKGRFLAFLFSKQAFLPGSHQQYSTKVDSKAVDFIAVKQAGSKSVKSYPFGVNKVNRKHFCHGTLDMDAIEEIIQTNSKFTVGTGDLKGEVYDPEDEDTEKMDMGTFLAAINKEKKDSVKIIFFISAEEEKKIRQRARENR